MIQKNFRSKGSIRRWLYTLGLALTTVSVLTACGQKAPIEKATEPSSAIESSKETTPTTPESSGDGKPTENSTANGKPSAEVPSTEVPNANNPNADKPSADNDPPPERQEAGSDKEDEDGSAANGSTENGKPSADQPSSDVPSTSKPSTGSSKPSTEKPSSSKPSTGNDKPSESSTPSSESPSAEKPSTEKPSTQKPSTEKPSSGLIGEVGQDPDGFITEEEVNKTCNGLHDYGPRNHAIVGENEYINGTACYKRYEKEWEECVNCGLKLLIYDQYSYYHQYTRPEWNDVYIVEGEMGCGKTWTTTSGTRCDCGMLDSVHTTTTTGDHTYEKQIDWSHPDIRDNPDGSRDFYVHWQEACLTCGDVRAEGWELGEHQE